MGRGERARSAGRARRRGRPADGALRRRRAAPRSCRRSCSAPACSWHLLRHGRRYDVVHTASFPYFSLLAAALAAPARPLPARRRLVRGLEPRVLARVPRRASAGASATLVQRLLRCACRSARSASRELHAGRLREEGLRGEVTVLRGRVRRRPRAPPGRAPAEPLVVFAGRHIPEKRAPRGRRRGRARARADRRAARRRSSATGPSARRVLAAIARARRSRASSRRPGSSTPRTVDAALRRALCLVLPSRREGYGLVVVEAAARGHAERRRRATPDNAAAELVEEGVNGFVAPSASTRRRSPRRSCACTRPATALRESHRRVVRRATRERLSLDGSLRRGRWPSYARQRARVARDASARAVRSQRERARRARGPRRAGARAARRRASSRSSAAAIAPRVLRVEQQRRVARDLGQRGRGPSRRPARRAPSPRAPAGRSPRTSDGNDERARRARRGPRGPRPTPRPGSARRRRRRAPRRARAARASCGVG